MRNGTQLPADKLRIGSLSLVNGQELFLTLSSADLNVKSILDAKRFLGTEIWGMITTQIGTVAFSEAESLLGQLLTCRQRRGLAASQRL